MSDQQIELTIEELQQQLEAAKQEAQVNLAGWQRAQADYQNLKKESEKRQGELMSFSQAAALMEVIPVYNHFKLALKHIPAEQLGTDWGKGLVQIDRLFEEVLKKFSIEAIATVGEAFDPMKHEALTHEEKEGFESDMVFEEVQPGYLYNGQVLVPAKVKVAK